MCSTISRPCLIISTFLIFCAWGLPSAQGDVVTLSDGRWIEGKVEEAGDNIKVILNNGTITIPGLLVKDILKAAEGKLSSKQRKERERIEKAIEEMKKHSMWRDAYVQETKHFVFKYNVTPEIAKGYIDMMEGFYKDFGKQLSAKLGPGHRRKKMSINICRDHENFQQIGGVPGALGFWNFVEEELYFFHDRNDPEFTMSVLLHEFTHLLTHLMKPKFNHPIWCNEGIAEYYGASTVENGKLVFGGIQEGRLVTMNKWREEGNDYSLERLIRVPRSGFGGLEYGWAWSFLHFVMHTPKYKKKFMKYYKGLAMDSGIQRSERGGTFFPTVKSSEDLKYFKKCFGLKNLDKINDEWHAYIDTVLKVTSGAGYLKEAKALWWKDENKKAWKMIKKAEEKWEGDPSPVLYNYKGRILSDLKKYSDAAASFRQAIELDPLNGWYYYRLGEALEDTDEKAVFKEAIRNKRLAREVMPGDYNLRYRVESDEERWKKGEDKKEDKG